MRKRRATFLSLKLPYCDDLALERTVFECAPGPRVAVVSGRLFSLRASPLVYEGTLLARIAGN